MKTNASITQDILIDRNKDWEDTPRDGIVKDEIQEIDEPTPLQPNKKTPRRRKKIELPVDDK